MNRFLWTLAALLVLAPGVRAQDMNLSQVLIDGEGWQKVAAPPGAMIFIERDARGNRCVYHLKDRKLVYEPARSEKTIVAEDIVIGGLALRNDGALYYTVPEQQVVYLYEPGGKPRKVAAGFGRPTGIVLSPDQGTLIVADANDRCLWALRIDPDMSLVHKERYYDVWVPRGQKVSGTTALTVDAVGRVYAATRYGVQMFDPTGRLSGILEVPTKDEPGPAIGFGGKEADVLHVLYGDQIYARKLKAKGVLPEKPKQ